ncbi:hypothetical protein L226DRAFT_577048 [Lentinus tigrinus ALCF2SS1-7]|uniref:uncharacterized protein n=1 Tax=Lentinus tigrinus ALCF2SS1-7 TaxID=1328758 RepID=UPI001165D9EE|nr:hypothetical protein L226DRAFT_577048 [Lentinus tigrinus ALCF2SS1-7]
MAGRNTRRKERKEWERKERKERKEREEKSVSARDKSVSAAFECVAYLPLNVGTVPSSLPTAATPHAQLVLSKDDKAFFDTLFHTKEGPRDDLRWDAFVKAMANLRFAIDNAGATSGSGVRFTAPDAVGKGKWEGRRRMRLDGPHAYRDGILRAGDQTRLAARLNEHFELQDYVANIPVEGEEPAPQAVEEPAADE